MQEKDVLPNYSDILYNNTIPKYLQTKYVKVSYLNTDSTEKLWEKHKSAIENPRFCDILPEQSLLDLKIEISDRIYHDCFFCENKCKVDREKNFGKCNTKNAIISTEFLHMGEESALVPSHTIFFSGCTFKCVFCQNWDISQNISGFYIEPKNCAIIIKKRDTQGSRNVNWVGGDPTPNLPFILKVLKYLEINTPQIWNSNMYQTIETMNLLNGVIDLYLTDFKYGNDTCAKRLSKIDDYFNVITRNHKKAYLTGDLVVRHLVMPNHLECCTKKILEWIKKEIPNSVVNLMDQYRPEYKAYNFKDIDRNLTKNEYEQAINIAKNHNLYLI